MILWTSSIWPPYEYAIITKFYKNRATFFINVQFWAQLQIFINSLYSILQNLLKGLSFFFFYYDILWQFFPQIQCRGTLGWVKCSLLTLAISDCSRRCYDCLGHQGWTCRNVSLLWNSSAIYSAGGCVLQQCTMMRFHQFFSGDKLDRWTQNHFQNAISIWKISFNC